MAVLNKKSKEALTDPLMKNNPISLQVLGICSALAVTVQLNTAVVMTLAVVSVLSISNTVISILRKMIPGKVRIIVQLSVNGGAFIECTQPGQSADTSCHVTGNGDTYWGVGEEVTISEGSNDLCSGPCDVQIKILNAVDNKLIYESTTVYVE